MIPDCSERGGNWCRIQPDAPTPFHFADPHSRFGTGNVGCSCKCTRVRLGKQSGRFAFTRMLPPQRRPSLRHEPRRTRQHDFPDRSPIGDNRLRSQLLPMHARNPGLDRGFRLRRPGCGQRYLPPAGRLALSSGSTGCGPDQPAAQLAQTRPSRFENSLNPSSIGPSLRRVCFCNEATRLRSGSALALF
jgi:hypothetical protein